MLTGITFFALLALALPVRVHAVTASATGLAIDSLIVERHGVHD